MSIQVAVFFGGKSVEHEVSVISGLQACAALDRGKYTAVPVYIAKDGAFYSGDEFGKIENYRDIPRLLENARQVYLIRSGGKVLLKADVKKLFGAEKPLQIDVALPVVHGTFAEDGTLQGYLETLGLPYAGSDVLSSAVSMDKLVTKRLLRAAGLPVLPEAKITSEDFAERQGRALTDLETEITYPAVVKPVNLGSSVGISKAENRDRLIEALALAFKFASDAIVEPAVIHLREINVAVLGDREGARASVCEEPIGRDEILSFKDKYMSGGKGKASGMSSLKRRLPADIPDELAKQAGELAVRAFQALGCSGVARVDFLLDTFRNTLYINEINPIPGSLAFYLWKESGTDFPALLEELISLAFARQRRRGELTFAIDTNLLSTTEWKGSKQ